ncbi:condensation domain-containing protein [Streptomyces sp. NPDC055089]
MVSTTHIALDYSVERSGSAPLIWGQLAIWDVLRWLPADDTTLNLSALCPVPAGVGLSAVLSALRSLVERHDSLHSVYSEGSGTGSDTPVQRVLESGELRVAVVEVGGGDPAEAAATCMEDMRLQPFDISVGLPLRAAVVVTEDGPFAVALVASHMAVDAWSLAVVCADLEKLFTDPGGAGLPERAQQPLERAVYESSVTARAREERTLAYWAQGIRDLPASMLEPAGGPGTAGPVWAEFDSAALAAAARWLGERVRMPPSRVVLAGVALLLAWYKGERQAALRLIVATRFTPQTQELVGAFNQNALFRVVVEDEPFEEYLRRASRAALSAYQHCECDPRSLEALVAEVARERGVASDGYCFFNDISGAAAPAVPGSAGEAPGAEEMRELRERSRLSVLDSGQTPKGSNFFLSLLELSERCVVSVCADRRFLAPADVCDVLLDLEDLLTRAAVRGQASTRDLRAGLRCR